MKTQIGIVLDSREAFDIYHDATGTFPPKMEEGKNTRLLPFRLKDEKGKERAALLVQQTGFEQNAEEKEAGQEVNGLTLAVALDAPPDEGERVLTEWTRSQLWPESK